MLMQSCATATLSKNTIENFFLPMPKRSTLSIWERMLADLGSPLTEEKKQVRTRFAVKKTFNLLYSGRIIPKKGIGILLKAAAHLQKQTPAIRVILVGPSSKSYRNELNRLARKLDVPLTFTGNMPPSIMHQAYWLGDCFICPTQFKEAFGLVNVEAMASGLPVIASHRGGIPEILNGQNGITICDYQNRKHLQKLYLR